MKLDREPNNWKISTQSVKNKPVQIELKERFQNAPQFELHSGAFLNLFFNSFLTGLLFAD